MSDAKGLQLLDGMTEIPAPSMGGLFVGGVPGVMQESIRYN